jgi:TonB-dependent starch-binding outer membrane protein SusC
LNISIPRNKLISYPDIEGSPYNNIYEVGRSLFVKKLFHYTGVDPQTGVYQFQIGDGHASVFNPIYPDDLQANKQVSQDFYGGFSNSFIYKNWKLDIFFQFVKQTGFNYLSAYFGVPGFSGNQPTEVLKRWQKPGDRADVQRFTQDYGSDAYTAFSNSQYYGDNSISDASFIRLKNVSLSYQIPANVTQKMHIQSLRFFLQGQNLATITHFIGMDPENQSTGNLPPLRVITAGLQITL